MRLFRAVRAAATRRGGPQACPAGCDPASDGRSDYSTVHYTFIDSLRHPFQRLRSTPCYGLPQQFVGSLGGSRHARSRLRFVVLCCRQSQRGLPGLQRQQRVPAEQRQSGSGSFRALRPASARLFFKVKGEKSNVKGSGYGQNFCLSANIPGLFALSVNSAFKTVSGRRPVAGRLPDRPSAFETGSDFSCLCQKICIFIVGKPLPNRMLPSACRDRYPRPGRPDAERPLPCESQHRQP